MANLKHPSHHLFFCAVLNVLVLLQNKVTCFQYKVGNLDAWGIPTSANPHLYTNWPKKLTFKIGDSLLFLYPPSQDSLIQVSEQSYNACNLKDPILYMNNGNSLFNITKPGELYFTSGQPGHCDKSQKLHISVLSADGSSVSPGPAASLPATAPSYPTVFGSIPAAPSPSSSPPLQGIPALSLAAAIGFSILALVGGSI